MITLYPVDPEIFIVESMLNGRQGVYNNIEAAKKHVQELFEADPDDHFWVTSDRLLSN